MNLNLIQANAILLSSLSLVVFLSIVRKMAKKKHPRYMWIIALYVFLIFLQLVIANYYELFKHHRNGKQNPAAIAFYLFIILEYSIFAFLLSRFIHLILIKNYLIISCFIFAVTAIFIWDSNLSFDKATSITTTIESFCLVPFCLYYFVELLNRPPLFKLTGEPSFWITTGILFLFIFITPYYLAYDYFKKIPEMGMIDFLSYDLLVILLAKASFLNFKQQND